MRNGKTQTAPTEAQLLATLNLLFEERDAARPRLRRLLASGEETASLRHEIVLLEARVDDIKLILETIAARRDAEAVAACEAEARQIEAEFAAKIEALLASLQAPSHPTQERHADE